MLRPPRLPATLLALVLAGMPAPLPANSPGASATTVADLDMRVARLGEGLAIAALGLCRDPVGRTGVDLHSRAQYGRLTDAQARAMFPLADGIALLLVVPGSVGHAAGLRPGDGLVAVDGTPMPIAAPGRRPDYAPTRRALDLLDAAMADGQALVRLRAPDGSERETMLTGTAGCPTRFQMEPGGGLQAEADGLYVKVGQAMVEAAADDAVLAASLAHELAHNILRHRERQNDAGMRRGLARMFGRNAALSRAAEAEADRLVPWLLARAGHDPAAALRWLDLLEQRIGPPAPTHPSWARRREVIGQQLPLIADLASEGRGLAPPFGTISLGPLVPDDD